MLISQTGKLKFETKYLQGFMAIKQKSKDSSTSLSSSKAQGFDHYLPDDIYLESQDLDTEKGN